MSDGFIIKRGGGSGDSNAAFKAYVDGSLTEVTADMLQGITSIRNYAFYHCSSLASVTIPSGVTSIGQLAFQSCSSLTSITIPNNVTSISNSAFSACINLASITIPNNVTSIGRSAFNGCSSLTSITIPNNVTSIGDEAFRYNGNLESVTVKATTPPTLGFGVFYNVSSNLVIYVPAESVDAYKAATNWSTYADKIQAIPSD